ncbi:MAG TPA: hypothetical protein VKU19_11840 [Bryobacteraceae bacterium]|nr:hypothetical protein [Bryobacteraceae bacterium]
MAARFYRWLVRLHPPAFRDRFGAEMLCVYTEADCGERPRLLADAALSLARQWLVRSRYWIVGGAVLAALLQITVTGTVWLGAARRALTRWLPDPALSKDSSAQSGVLLLGAGLVCAVLLLITALSSLVVRAPRRK